MITVPRGEDPRVSIVIATSRKGENLRACLESLVRHACDGVACEVIVVLNGAADEVTAVARGEQVGATVIEAPLDIGFPAGINLGRSAARGEYLVVLHDDTSVCPGWLAALVETADAHPEAGAVASLVLWPDGRVQNAEVVTWRDAEWTMLGDGDDPDAPQYEGVRAVDTASGASLLVRAATFDAVGGLDADLYPAGFVDQTLTNSIWRIGQVVLVDPRSRVHHRRAGGVVGRELGYRHFAAERNRARFVRRFADRLDRLPPRPSDPDELAAEIAATRDRVHVAWRQRAREWIGELPPASRVVGPFSPDASADERLAATQAFLTRERAMRDAWDSHLVAHIEQVENDNAALRESRDEAVAYAKSLEAERTANRPPG